MVNKWGRGVVQARMRISAALVVMAMSVPTLAAADSAFKLTAEQKSGRPLYTLVATRAPLHLVVKEVSKQTGTLIEVERSRQNLTINVVIVDASEQRLLSRLAEEAGLRVAPGRVIRLQLAEPTAALDVKDEDVRVILASLRKQCAIRNLVIDPEVSGQGTFLFRDVPCSEAFSVVFASLGLRGDFGENSTGSVARRP
jgi:hypothetical protein